METGRWTMLFVALLSFNIATAFLGGLGGSLGGGSSASAGSSAGASAGMGGGLFGGLGLGGGAGGKMGGKSNFSGWSETCTCNEELETELDECLDNIRDKIKRGFSLKDQSVQGAEMSDGAASGFHKFERKGPYRCKVQNKFARIYFQIGFVRLVFSYFISANEGFWGNAFGDLATVTADAFAEAGDTACKMGFPDIVVDVILRQDFDGDGGIVMEEFSLGAMNGMSFLDGSGPFQAAADALTPIFFPIFQVFVTTLLQTDVQTAFQEEFKNVHAERYMFIDSEMEEDDDVEMHGRGRGRGSGSVTVVRGGGGGRGGARGSGAAMSESSGGGGGRSRSRASGAAMSESGGGGGGGGGSMSRGYSESVSTGDGGGRRGGRRGGRTEYSSSSSGSSSSRSESSNAGSRVYYTYEEDYEDE